MGAGGIGGGTEGERSGTRVLTMLAAPLNALVLHRLSEGPRRLVELRRETGSPPQTTLRARLGELGAIGAVGRRRLRPFPSVREYLLTNQPGTELRFVASTLEAWLAKAPQGPLPLGSQAAQAAVKAFVDAWSSTIVHALAAGPATVAELGSAVGSLSHPSLERRIGAMRAAGLLEAGPSREGDSAYVVTEWLRQGIAPLSAAARWERRHLADETVGVVPVDAEAALLLVVPLLQLPPEMSGSCRLGVEFADAGESRLVGVTVDVEAGKIVSCRARLESSPGAWATGPVRAWLRAMIEANFDHLELGGNHRLAHIIVDGLNRALFPPRLI